MKKLICILLSMMMVLGTGVAYAENYSYQKALFRLASLDILPADLEEEAKITRADAAAAMVKLLIDDASWPGGDTGFTDVKSFDDFAGYVYYAKALGIVSGDGDDTFRPFDPLMMNELTKMAVNLLGYEEMAEQEGGYPSGYLSLALRQNLFKNVGAAEDGFILAEGLVFMLDNLLKSRPMEKKVGTEEYEISEDTLLDQILERRNTKNIKGIVTAVGEAVLADEQETLEDEISIDGVRYQYEADDKFDLLGKYVNAYYMEDRQTDRNVIANILVQDMNEEIIVAAEDIVSLDLTQLEYEDPVNPEKRTRRAKIAQDADFLYNKRLYTPESFDVTSGQIRLLDSGGDGTYDTVFVDEYKSYIVDRVVLENQTVYFKEGETYQNKTGFKFDTDDEEKQYHLYDAEGNEMEFTDIAPDMVISLTSDVNQTINYATLSTNKVEGEVTLLDTDANEIAIDGQTYQLYRGQSETYQIGQTGVFLLNHNQEVVGTADISSGEKYGYIIKTAKEKGVSGNLQIKVVGFGSSKREVTETAGVENITFTYANSETQVLEFSSDKINYQGPSDLVYNRVAVSEIDESDFYRGVAIYQTDAEGKIRKLRIVTIPESAKLTKYGFNGRLNSFGGLSSQPAFFIGANTQVICVPLSTETGNNLEEDYAVDVTIADKSEVYIVPVDIDEKTQIAEAAVILEQMDYSVPKPFDSTDKMSIVGQVISKIDDSGELIYQLETLTEDEIETPYIRQDQQLATTVSTLKCGDLIYYNTNQNGEINNVQFVASLSTLENNYFIDSISGGKKMIFAQAQSIERNRLDARYNEMVDVLTLTANGETKRYSAIFREDGPAVYCYERRSGKIRSASTDEIQTIEEVGDAASDLFISEKSSNTPEVIVIVEK